MKDIKTKEVTTKPKTKNPASRIPKELMRTAILESKEKSQTIANARDNDMGEQSPSEYASGKVASAEEWAARKTGRTVTRAGKTAAQTSYEKIKLRAAGRKEAEKEAARGTGDTQAPDPVSREAPEQKNREQTSENVKIKSREAQEAQIKDVQIQKAKRQKAISDAVKTKEQKIRAAREKDPGRELKVLNLFAYTGGATISAANAGANVTHVDASKGMVTWAKENAVSSNIPGDKIRWLVDDCAKFVEREIRRGNTYDGIIMDPPSYGRGPKGEIWKIEESIFPFIELTSKVLSKDPVFFLINSYTTGLQPAVLSYMLNTVLTKKLGGCVAADEIGLPVTRSGLVLPCGASGRWSMDA